MEPSLHVETPLSRFYKRLLFSTLFGLRLVVQSPSLSAILNRDVFLKLENLQPGGSFKIRGIGHTMQVTIRVCSSYVTLNIPGGGQEWRQGVRGQQRG